AAAGALVPVGVAVAADVRGVFLLAGTWGQAENMTQLADRLKAEGYTVKVMGIPAADGTLDPGADGSGDPRSGTGSIAASAAIIADQVRAFRDEVGADKVGFVGFSQGGAIGRYAIKYNGLDSVVDQYVSLAGVQQGTMGDGKNPLCILTQQACRDMAWGSGFLKALNAGDPAPGPVRYTAVGTTGDDTITPPLFSSGVAEGGSYIPAAGQALDGSWVTHPQPNVTNLNLQQACNAPGLTANHWGAPVGMPADVSVYTIVSSALRGEEPACGASRSNAVLPMGVPLPVVNGQFTDTGATVVGSADRRVLAAGESWLGGWTAIGAGAEVYGEADTGLGVGVRSVDLNGAAAFGGIQTTLATRPGVPVTVRFLASTNVDTLRGANGQAIREAALYADTGEGTAHTEYVLPLTATQTPGAGPDWQAYLYTFTPTSTSTTVRFLSDMPATADALTRTGGVQPGWDPFVYPGAMITAAGPQIANIEAVSMVETTDVTVQVTAGTGLPVAEGEPVTLTIADGSVARFADGSTTITVPAGTGGVVNATVYGIGLGSTPLTATATTATTPLTATTTITTICTTTTGGQP
ncbi:lipase family alpha/beta hydrolase, partial [Arenibacterium sp. S380]|uniref:lipase family alpha/beta hydrolase n=1 Tax=Arenibacterium sp. S380 TaxID=3415138 RepID=UPI003C7C480B